MKTEQEVINFFKSKGFKEYPSTLEDCKSFEKRWTDGKYRCECNGRVPGIHVQVHDYYFLNSLRHQFVDFLIFGEFHGQWTYIKVYGILFSDLEKEFDKVIRRAKAMWNAYCEEV